MKSFLIKALGIALAAAATLAATGTAIAQSDYPNRPIRIVVGYVPGPGPDFAARSLGPKLTEILGQPIVVENRAGAAGTLATAYVVSQPADGYTLLMAEAAQLEIAPYVYKSLSYSALKDLTPIGLVTDGAGVVLASNPKFTKIKSLQDMVQEAKKNPKKLTYGTAGIGSTHHLIVESFKGGAGIDMLHIPYKGGGQSLPAFLGGEVDVWIGSLQSIWPHVRAGSATLLAVSAGTRLGVIPDVPSLSEVVPGFHLESHTGLLGPAGMPPEIVAKLSAAIKIALQDPALRIKLSAEGTRAVRTTTSAEYADMIRSNQKKYEQAAKKANIQPQ